MEIQHFSRRRFLAASLAGLTRSARAQGGPNVLFVSVDDLNDWIGCLGGYAGVKTPNLDRLAARGVLFTNAHCNAPLCNASRASLMTGIRPSTSGVYTNSQPFRESPVLRRAVTLSQHFKANGYRAVGAGKIYHSPFPDPASWDDYFPSQEQNKPADPAPPRRPLNGIPDTSHFDWGPVHINEREMGDWKVATWVSEQLSRRHEQPLFLGCGFYRPHLPWYVPPKYFDMYPLDRIELPSVKEDDLDDVPPMGRKIARPEGDHRKVIEHGQWKKAIQGYLASITFADAMLGRVLDALDAGPMAKNTAVVLWSDHGWHLGEKHHWRKFALWEEATRCVLMMAAPGVPQPGGRCGRPVSLIDIYPTLNQVCGLPARRELEGQSLMPLLRNPAAPWDRPVLTTYLRGNHAVRDERWRYIRYADGSEELYDRQADPMEWTNLASRRDLAAEKRRLARWLPKTDAPDSLSKPGVRETVI
ncbi:MAG: sulfatase [Bryobacterales bacterium]|nr:sulfatase [Bryobacterales bacterium]